MWRLNRQPVHRLRVCECRNFFSYHHIGCENSRETAKHDVLHRSREYSTHYVSKAFITTWVYIFKKLFHEIDALHGPEKNATKVWMSSKIAHRTRWWFNPQVCVCLFALCCVSEFHLNRVCIHTHFVCVLKTNRFRWGFSGPPHGK